LVRLLLDGKNKVAVFEKKVWQGVGFASGCQGVHVAQRYPRRGFLYGGVIFGEMGAILGYQIFGPFDGGSNWQDPKAKSKKRKIPNPIFQITFPVVSQITVSMKIQPFEGIVFNEPFMPQI